MSAKLLPYLESFDAVIWDWNGTLLDDLAIILKAEAEHFPLYGIQPPSREARDRLFCFPVEKYYERLGFSFAERPFAEINGHFLDVYDRLLQEAPLFREATETLTSIKSAGKKQFILSAAMQGHLHEILARHEIAELFDAVYGLPHKIADSKIQRGRELLSEQGLDPNKCILIGDTEHDLEVAQHLGMEVLLVADGHHPYERLSKVHHRVLPSRY